MTLFMADLFKSFDKNEVSEALYMMQGRVAPKYMPIEFNFAGKMMVRSFGFAWGLDKSEINRIYGQKGDLGLVAQELWQGKDCGLDVVEIFQKLREIALISGKDSQKIKSDKVVWLLKNLNSISCKYIVRIILGKLRLGMSDKTILDALSWSIKGDKSLRPVIESAYGARSDIGVIVENALKKGEKGLKDIKIEVGTPVASKLVERERSTDAIIKRMRECIVQPKYDGLRSQIHYNKSGIEGINSSEKLFGGEKVKIFSRNMEDITPMFPDIVTAIQTYKVDSIVIDSETIGYNEKEDKFIPFQETIQRKRKYDVADTASRIPIIVFSFDIIYLNGEDISKESLEKRLSRLKEIIEKNKNGIIRFSESKLIGKVNDLEEVFNKYISEGLEGIIAKKKDSTYDPGTRNFDWIKLKRSSRSNLVDTIDVVVLGYYYGRGIRAKFGIGALLVGVLDKEEQKFESIAKLGTGMKDEDWRVLKEKLEELKVDTVPNNVLVDKMLIPDVWVDPYLVLEIEADEITKSSLHIAGKKEGKQGFSLRFPRLKKIRWKKDAEDISKVDEVDRMYKLQYNKKN